jgi:hypothetical protein
MLTEKTSSNLGRSRSDTLNMRIESKVKYLATLAARELDITLSRFIERAIERALTVEAMQDAAIPSEMPLYNEGSWNEDEATRFFLVAVSRHDLLIPSEQQLWKLFTLNYIGKKFTLNDFREFWNHPMIDTEHLDTDSVGGE